MRYSRLAFPLALFAFLMVTAAAAPAQEQPRTPELGLTALSDWVRLGDEIRIRLVESRGLFSGRLEGISKDSLIIRTESQNFLGVPIASMVDLQVKRHGGATLGTVVGGLVGVAAGIGILVNNFEEDCSDEFFQGYCESENVALILTPIAMAVTGAFLGRLIGRSIAPERWESVPLRDLSLSPVANGELGISMKVTLALDR